MKLKYSNWVSVVFGLVSLMAGMTFGSAASFAAAAEKEWTIAVFLNGDNNLDSYGTADMKEMEQVGSSDRLNIVVLRDTSVGTTTSKIYYVQKGSSQVVKDFGSNIDMGDYKTLVEFYKYVKENYPAKHFLVDVWNHGAGWKLKNFVEPVKGISYDDHSGNHITTPQLGDAFRQMVALNGGKKIDIFGMDACLMQMAEVAYEVADSADYMIGSEQTEPADGWAYGEFLKYLAAKPDMSPEELAITIEREYVKSYSGGVQGTQPSQGSVVAPDRLVAATQKINELAAYLMAITPKSHEALLQAIDETQQYAYNDYKDLIHFVNLAQKKTGDLTLRALTDEAVAAIQNAVVANFVKGDTLKGSTGLSVWIPTAYVYEGKKKDYDALRWSRDTYWDDFLRGLLVPSTPVVSLTGVKYTDENNDGFYMPGEKLTFKVDMKNESPVAAEGAIMRVVAPQGLTVEVGEVKVEHFPKGVLSVDGLSIRVNQDVKPGLYDVGFAFDIPGVGVIEKAFPVTIDGNYTMEDVKVSSPHPYVSSTNLSWKVTKSGVAGMRIHFAKFDTESRFDYVSIYDQAGVLIVKYDGKKEAFWTPYLEGNSFEIRLTSDSVINKYGFDIDKIAY